ncbi:MAG: hypothetical protein PHV34_13585 [Verrucomicrobiae bacterium]|nr:hypothetical protein [Verrucomicrobiae bacterium]
MVCFFGCKGWLGILWLMVAAVAVAGPETEMVKVVYRVVYPDSPAGAFRAQPRTLYRYGDRCGRTEEMPDVLLKVHGLIIVNEPNIWMINLANKTGRHVIDPGPTYRFYSPIIPPDAKDKPMRFPDFEVGREIQFMKGRGVEPLERMVDGKKHLVYDCQIEKLLLRLMCHPVSKTPLKTMVFEDGRLVTVLQYDDYQTGLTVDKNLFEPPSGIQIAEH